MSGCSGATEIPAVENVELVDPVGVALSYDEVAKRTIYDEKILNGLVCAYTEEYELSKSMTFQAFDVYPGDTVKKGESLLHSYTDNIDEQIEQKEKYIAQMDKQYQEFLEDSDEAYKEPKEKYDLYKKAVENMNRVKPEEMIKQVDEETGEEIEVPNPEYASWNQEFKGYDGIYRNATLTLDKWTQERKEREELYNLDREYQQVLLKRLKAQKLDSGLVSGMTGTVTSIKFINEGDWLNEHVPLMAVADLEQKQIQCDYIGKGAVTKAKEVYALINGKRYEVEYQPMESDEYKQLEEKNGKVYSTFKILSDAEDVEMGSYVVIVLVNNVYKDVLTVPKDAVSKDETTSYVYVVNGNESVYTPVKTGVSDGGYVEIVNGLEEGDKVLSSQAVVSGDKTIQLEKGEIHYNFEGYATAYYPSSQLIKNPVEYGTAYYLEKQVSMNQQVQKGDVLATVRVVPDSVELKRKEQQLARERERIEDLRKEDEEKNRKAIAAREENAAELEKSIAEMKASFAIKEIKAPMSGIINRIWEKETETLIQKNENLFLISNEASSYVFVQDENSNLSYGNTVTIIYEDANKAEQKIQGMVVNSNPMSVGKELTSGNVMDFGWDIRSAGSLVKVSAEDMGKLAGSIAGDGGWWNRGFYSAKAQTRKMENVVLVPKKAVKEISGTPYVKVKKADGSVIYQSFVAGGADSSTYWVVDGLTEGMEICIE